MNQIPSDEIAEGGMNAAATDMVLQQNAFVITPFKINVPQTISRMRKATLSSPQQDGARMRSRMAPACASLIQLLRRSRPVSACWKDATSAS
jgi:hypothetical protein